MRGIRWYFVLVLGMLRLADPVAHSLVHHHDHHDQCVERGVHLHEVDDICSWTDPAYLAGLEPADIGWEFAGIQAKGLEPQAPTSRAKCRIGSTTALRGPPAAR